MFQSICDIRRTQFNNQWWIWLAYRSGPLAVFEVAMYGVFSLEHLGAYLPE